MKKVILSSNHIQVVYELTLFAFKEPYSLNNNKFLSSISLKIMKQKNNKNIHSIQNEGTRNQITLYNIKMKESEWKTILFLLDLHLTIKKRKALKTTYFDKYIRVSNHILRVPKSKRHDPDWKIKQRSNKLKLRQEISSKIKSSLNLKNKLVQRCDNKILSYSLKRA